MFVTIDCIDVIFSLAEDLWQYLFSTCSNLNGSRSSPQPAISFALQHHWQQCTNVTFPRAIADFADVFASPNPSTTVQEDLHLSCAERMHWADDIMGSNDDIKSLLVKAVGRCPDDPPEMLADVFVDGRLSRHILS